MKKSKYIIGSVMLVALLLAVACGSAAAVDDNGGETQNSVLAAVNSPSGAGSVGAEDSTSGRVASSINIAGISFEGGISVSGTGTLTVEPDVAILVLGVSAKRDNVAQARDDAAAAMDGIAQVLSAHGVADTDIKTLSLSIQPVYDYSRDKQELSGFQVSNIVRVKIKDLDSVGAIIDDTVNAGGDLTRIQSIGFTVDDPTPMQSELREKAVEDAMGKAQQLAGLAGVTLGAPVSISEGGGAVPLYGSGIRAFAEAAPAVATSVSPGEMELSLSVSMVFAIQ